MGNKKVTLKTDKIVSAYQILTAPTTPEKKGISLSDLDTPDIFKVIRAVNTFKPVAVAFDDFRKDAAERLKPDGWDEIVEKLGRFKELPDDDRAAVNKVYVGYDRKVRDCVQSELDKDREIDIYEHLSEDAIGKLIRANGHILDVPAIMLLNEILG